MLDKIFVEEISKVGESMKEQKVENQKLREELFCAKNAAILAGQNLRKNFVIQTKNSLLRRNSILKYLMSTNWSINSDWLSD